MAKKKKIKGNPDTVEVRRADLPLQMRGAAFAPDTLDEEKRTVEIVWSTGARVPRSDPWTGKRYEEELSMDPDHVDLSRLQNGASVLDAHFRWSMGGQIGVVEDAWIVDGEGRAILRFADDKVSSVTWDKVRSGIARNVSVGYVVRTYEVTEHNDKPSIYRAVDWQPQEISFVPIGADQGAGTRAAEDVFPCEFVNRATAQQQESDMPKKVNKAAAGQPDATNQNEETRAAPVDPAPAAQPDPTPAPAPAPAPAVDADAIRAGERDRITAIRAAGDTLGVDTATVDTMIDDGVPVYQARAQMIDAVAEGAAGQNIRGQVTQAGADNTDPEV